MISYIRGELAEIGEDHVVVDVGGVGYGIFMSGSDMASLPRAGQEVKIHTYLHVKEDLMQLFGFLTKDGLEVFKLIIGVSGIGPKGGLSILTQMTPNDLRFAVMAGDAKAISKAQGIGKKTAEKLILELKDKLKLSDTIGQEADAPSVSGNAEGAGQIQNEAVEALAALGYGSTEAFQAVRNVEINEDSTVEDVLKQALRQMALF
nr:Holliday junction branch migration protein RuvA [uncultured Sellimonas sp.]